MDTITKALTPFEVKGTDDAALTFEGLSSTWDLDLGGDVIEPGAFSRTLEHWRGSKKVIPLIDQHNYGSVRAVVGKMMDAKETDAGLWSRFQILDTDDGREIYARLKGGFVDGLSIGYRVVGEPEERDGLRHLKEIALEEVSVVIWPMNPGARATDVKAVPLEQIEAAIRSLKRDDRHAMLKLLNESPAEEARDGMEPDDPARIALEERFRRLRAQSLAV